MSVLTSRRSALSLFTAAALFSVPLHAAGLNDTGQTLCYNGGGGTISCTVAPAADDGRYGRDAAATAGVLPKTGAGSAGFDFTKIANNGSVLAASAVLGSGPTDWACTRDNVTGSMWEIKTASGLHSSAYTYTWYDSNPATNGGGAGTASGGACLTAGRCDTEKFTQDVNAAGLCGYADWRMPKKKELRSIVDQSRFSPAIDPGYFPNIVSSYFWSASSDANYSNYAWSVYFGHGYAYGTLKYYAFQVRLVRAGQ